MSKQKSARSIALNTLLESEKGRHYATELLNMEFSRTALDARDSALTTQLVYGTIRMRGAIDWMISRFSNRPLEKIETTTLMCLRLAVYQLFYLDKIPEHAAVNESVNLARARANPGAAMFVNAVLRRFLAEKDNLEFPKKDEDPVQHISVIHSHPQFLVERWIKHFGIEQTEDICRINNIPAPLFVRTNTLKLSRDELVERLKDEGVEAQPVEGIPVALRLRGCSAPSALRSFRRGLFYVQDISAMKVVHKLKPRQNDKVLDMCAAPGGKTTYIAQQMQKHGTIVACDSDEIKVERMKDNLRRLGITNVTVVICDAIELPERYSKGSFDRVLVDAPCSNTGVLRRRVEARWRLREEDFERLPNFQRKLLEVGSRMVKKEGVLIYSTCSIDRAENEEVAKYFLSEHEGFRLNFEETFFPEENGGDGGYIARFVRSA